MTQYDFMGKAKLFGLVSAVLFVGSILAMVTLGLRPGIDFTGGIQLTLLYPAGNAVSAPTVRGYVAQILGAQATSLPYYVQTITAERDVPGTGRVTLPGVVVTVRTEDRALAENLRKALLSPAPESGLPQPVEHSLTEIGAQVSREIVNRAWQAVLVALAAMLVYIAVRFRLRYGVAAVLALVHDVVLTLGVFSVFRLEINLPVIAALLTVVGYSINDTIVVFDRIRENLRLAKKASLWEVINRSINQTLTRTLNTSSTTLLPILVLLVVAGIALREFTVAMACGVIFGTYSSIFIASPILYGWARIAEKLRAR